MPQSRPPPALCAVPSCARRGARATTNVSLGIRVVMNYRQTAIDLFEQEDAAEIVSESQRRKRPHDIGAFLEFVGEAAKASNHENQAAGVLPHVFAEELGELFGGPGFPAGIKHHHTIRNID